MSETDNNTNVSNDSHNNDSSSNDKPVEYTRLTGRVKWFNNKTGFGFITALTDSEGVKEGSDVFVHHSTIKVAQEQYRYLVQGEYVEFILSKTADSSKHEFQASDVSGVKGGKLICETRWESRSSGTSRFKPSAEGSSEWKTVESRNNSAFSPKQSGSRSGSEWRRGDSSARGRGRGGRGGNSNE